MPSAYLFVFVDDGAQSLERSVSQDLFLAAHFLNPLSIFDEYTLIILFIYIIFLGILFLTITVIENNNSPVGEYKHFMEKFSPNNLLSCVICLSLF